MQRMKTCTHCQKDNPDDFKHCRYCGAEIMGIPANKPNSIWKRIPAWAWIIIIVACIAGVLFVLIGSFIAVATLEGVASIILLVLGVIGFGIAPLRKPENPGSFTRAIGLSFFALMGATVDQPGNIIYNKPVEMCFCTDGSSLSRDENISNPMPGTTIIQQDFTCFDKMGNPVKQINMFAVLGIRFLEYILLGYLLIALRSVIWKFKNNT
ncbi:MAG: zinc ribbon domain-containing protein [Chitinophagales bacterium]